MRHLLTFSSKENRFQKLKESIIRKMQDILYDYTYFHAERFRTFI